MANKNAFRVDTTGAMREFKNAKVDMNRAIPIFLGRMAGDGEKEMKRLIPVDTGYLRSSTGSQVINDNAAVITNSANYAWYVNDGTRPHTIEPKNASVLAFTPSGAREGFRGGQRVQGIITGSQRTGLFTFGGRTVDVGLVYATRVYHPGTAGQKFVEKTINWLEENGTEIATKVIRKFFRS